jgi:aminoglycoside phosphotransferase (APT) family kinase protein
MNDGVQIESAATPAAEVKVDDELLRRLLREQHPDLADATIALVDEGWDNVTLRVGEALAARLPRRALAVPLIENEQRWLPVLAPRLPLAAPEPVRLGAPSPLFPWPWSLVRWIEGQTADRAPPGPHQGPALAGFFKALHQPAPVEAPSNPFRGVPLAERRASVEARLQRLRQDHALPLHLWDRALSSPIDAAPVWLHGDPHARNVLTREGRLVAFIDWGDMCAGDPANDLAALWMLLPGRSAREAALDAYGPSAATAERARGWAFLFATLLLDSGLVDHPRHALMGKATFDRLQDGP